MSLKSYYTQTQLYPFVMMEVVFQKQLFTISYHFSYCTCYIYYKQFVINLFGLNFESAMGAAASSLGNMAQQLAPLVPLIILSICQFLQNGFAHF